MPGKREPASKRMKRILNGSAMRAERRDPCVVSIELAVRGENAVGSFGDELVLTRRKTTKGRFLSLPSNSLLLGRGPSKSVTIVFPDTRE